MRLRAITHIHAPCNWLGLGMSNAYRPYPAPSRRFLRNDSPRLNIVSATRTRCAPTAPHNPPVVMTPETRGATRAKSRSVRDTMNTRASNAPSFTTGARWAPPGAWRPPELENPPVFHRETLWFAPAPPIDYIHFTSSKEPSHEHSEGTGKVPRSRRRVSIAAPSCWAETSAAHSTMRGGSTTKTP